MIFQNGVFKKKKSKINILVHLLKLLFAQLTDKLALFEYSIDF